MNSFEIVNRMDNKYHFVKADCMYEKFNVSSEEWRTMYQIKDDVVYMYDKEFGSGSYEKNDCFIDFVN